jgi:SAM-dependent methyltransferase
VEVGSVAVEHPLDALLADPWSTLRLVLGEPLHPGGLAATGELLDRAGVGDGTRLLDVGCGAGEAVAIASERGASAIGVDVAPGTDATGVVRGDAGHLPVRDGSVDVVLAECAICLSDDLDASLREARRVLVSTGTSGAGGDGTNGRLALSDVVVEGAPPALPGPIARALCLTGPRSRSRLVERVEDAGFAVGDVREHREDLLAMRDRAASRVDYVGLLGSFGDRGRRLLEGVRELERAVEDGRVGYVSIVATVDG